MENNIFFIFYALNHKEICLLFGKKILTASTEFHCGDPCSLIMAVTVFTENSFILVFILCVHKICKIDI